LFYPYKGYANQTDRQDFNIYLVITNGYIEQENALNRNNTYGLEDKKNGDEKNARDDGAVMLIFLTCTEVASKAGARPMKVRTCHFLKSSVWSDSVNK
jgi:hypothetical protein